MTLKVAILASGSGSNVQAIMDKVAEGVLDLDIRVVLSNKADAFVLKRAEQAGLPCAAIPHVDFPDRESFDRAMVEAIIESGADTVVLAGYMRMLTPFFLNSFPDRVINIHPAVLPAFPGVRGGKDALDYGVKIAGCTVHFVNEIMDNGPVIIQAAVPVVAGEPLEALMERIHKAEHRIYPQALQWMAEGRLELKGRVVHLASAEKEHAAPPEGMLISPPLDKGF